ncbi:MAG TPA: hypothetical protein VJK54_04075 [Chthoniobacterales bacterium]|nr:hypothetical protein [Chthoniobacterales bacterium]
MDPSPNFLPPLHPPGRSRTKSAWSALIALFLLFIIWCFHPILLRTSVRTALWITRPLTGLTIKARTLHVDWGKPLYWQDVTILSGQPPHQSQIELKELKLKLASPWKILFGTHQPLEEFEASEGKGVIDLQTEESSTLHHLANSLLKKNAEASLKRITWLPSTLSLHKLSLLIIAEDQRYNIKNLSCSLPHKTLGRLSYDEAIIEAGTIECHLPKGSCDAFWDDAALTLNHLSLIEGVIIRRLQFLFYPDAISFGLASEIFQGILRADGRFTSSEKGVLCEGALLGEKLPIDRLSKFLGLTKKISGLLHEGRLTFRGSPLHMMDAEASLRMSADNVRVEKRGWASLAITANLIGRKISVTHFQLKQHDNQVTASGEMTLTEAWRKIAQAPFSLKLKAMISDASQLADLVGPPWEKVTGKLSIEGEVHGAANHAEGYINAHGTTMTGYGLPIDSLELEMIFQGEKTDIANIDLWSGSDRLQLSGIVENSWPHHYEGKGNLSLSNITKRLHQIGFENTNAFEEGNLMAHWNGDGTATNHQGFFDFSLKHLQKNLSPDKMTINLQGNGAYHPEELLLSDLILTQISPTRGSSQLTTKLLLSSQGIKADDLILLERDTMALSGNIFLPINAMALLQGKSFIQACLPKKEFQTTLSIPLLNLDSWATIFSSSTIPFSHGQISGALSFQGSLSQPQVTGDLDLKASELTLGNFLPPLHSAQAKLHFAQENMNLTESSALLGKGKIIGNGSTRLHNGITLHHDYQFNGHHLLFYQSEGTSHLGGLKKISGDASLSLQGENNQGILRGSINLTNINWNPELLIIPFLAPPGILLNQISEFTAPLTNKTLTTSSWTTDLSVTAKQSAHTLSSSNPPQEGTMPLQEINLHLVGDMMAPIPEGKITFNKLLLLFPQMEMKVIQGGLVFNSNQPWIPYLNLTALGKTHGKTIKAICSETAAVKTLSLESELSSSPEILALFLSLPKSDQTPREKSDLSRILFQEKSTAEGWIAQLPYLIRKQQIEKPLTLKYPFTLLPSLPGEPGGLGFTSQGISYSATIRNYQRYFISAK